MGGRFAVFAVALAAAGSVGAPAAEAAFHLVMVREVHPGAAEDSYVELQAYAAGQNFVAGHAVTVYDSAGGLVHTSSFSNSVANGENQRTILLGDSSVQAAFGVAPDLVDPGLSIVAAGGAACWNAGSIPADCVAWGNFSGGAELLAATGTSAGPPASPGGIAAATAIRRTIAPGCPTLLEVGDDSDASSADFSEVTPAPRNNAAAVVEAECPGVPNTTIESKPPLNSNSTSATFTYQAPTATGYECKLDSAVFLSCPVGGQEYTGLPQGSHTFQVRGLNASGPDPTPATHSWKVDTVGPTVTIDTAPADPSPGGNASFTFHADEPTSKFECSLAKGAAADAFSVCSSGKTYSGLADDAYTFKVRATDLADNLQPTPTAFSWQVDNSLADTTPPETTIASRPPDPSVSSTASFTYQSNEAGSTFQCAIDGAPLLTCSTAGVTYAGLASGPHTFMVRAIDPSANVDPTPAGYSFTVVLGTPALALPTPPPASAPETILVGKPPAKTSDRTPSFRFRSDPAGAAFQCAVDRQQYKACGSPFTTKPLGLGRHSVSVRAVAAGLFDPSPAKLGFKVVAKGRR